MAFENNYFLPLCNTCFYGWRIFDPCLNRHKCSACYKQYKKKEHLVEHMRVSFHSVHQPRCAVCQKHCKSFESLREHLNGGILTKSFFYHLVVHVLSCSLLVFFSSLHSYHLGSLPKGNCSKIFSERGCYLCLKLFDSSTTLSEHKEMCCLPAPASLVS